MNYFVSKFFKKHLKEEKQSTKIDYDTIKTKNEIKGVTPRVIYNEKPLLTAEEIIEKNIERNRRNFEIKVQTLMNEIICELEKYNLSGTFYCPEEDVNREVVKRVKELGYSIQMYTASEGFGRETRWQLN